MSILVKKLKNVKIYTALSFWLIILDVSVKGGQTVYCPTIIFDIKVCVSSYFTDMSLWEFLH